MPWLAMHQSGDLIARVIRAVLDQGRADLLFEQQRGAVLEQVQLTTLRGRRIGERTDAGQPRMLTDAQRALPVAPSRVLKRNGNELLSAGIDACLVKKARNRLRSGTEGTLQLRPTRGSPGDIVLVAEQLGRKQKLERVEPPLLRAAGDRRAVAVLDPAGSRRMPSPSGRLQPSVGSMWIANQRQRGSVEVLRTRCGVPAGMNR